MQRWGRHLGPWAGLGTRSPLTGKGLFASLTASEVGERRTLKKKFMGTTASATALVSGERSDRRVRIRALLMTGLGNICGWQAQGSGQDGWKGPTEGTWGVNAQRRSVLTPSARPVPFSMFAQHSNELLVHCHVLELPPSPIHSNMTRSSAGRSFASH